MCERQKLTPQTNSNGRAKTKNLARLPSGNPKADSLAPSGEASVEPLLFELVVRLQVVRIVADLADPVVPEAGQVRGAWARTWVPEGSLVGILSFDCKSAPQTNSKSQFSVAIFRGT